MDRDSGVEEEIEAETFEDACSQASDWVQQGDYSDIESTVWVDCFISTEDDEVEETITVAIDPEEPECSEEYLDHDFQSPYDILGGCKENPGVYGSGGGVAYTEVCMNCGCGKHVNTWAQRHDTGEQGLTSVRYVVKEFMDEIKINKYA